MKFSKAAIWSYFCQPLSFIITAGICFAIYHWGSNNEKACFALTLGAIAFLFLCFYNIIFKNNSKGMVMNVLDGLFVILFANKLYDYEKLVALIPILKNIDPVVFCVMVLGAVLFALLIIRFIIYIYDNNISTPNVENDISPMTSSHVGNRNDDRISSIKERDVNNITTKNRSNTWIVIYCIFLLILIGAGCAIFNILYENGVLKYNYDFFEVVASLLKYVGSVAMLILAVVVVIIFLIEMIRIIVLRIQVFATSLKEDKTTQPIPLYVLSVVLDIIVCYIAYRFSGFTIDSFYNFVNSGEYIAFPLLILFGGIAFVIFLRLTHTTLLLLVEMKSENIKEFLKKINNKADITNRVIEIVKMLIDIVLNSIILVLKFVIFIPDFVGTIYAFVLQDEDEFNNENEGKYSSSISSDLNQNKEEV